MIVQTSISINSIVLGRRLIMYCYIALHFDYIIGPMSVLIYIIVKLKPKITIDNTNQSNISFNRYHCEIETKITT